MKNTKALFIFTNTALPLAITTALRIIDPPIPVGLYVGFASVLAITAANYHFVKVIKTWRVIIWVVLFSNWIALIGFGELSVFSGAVNIYTMVRIFLTYPFEYPSA
ncbi:MAG: hypothetical protein AAF720_01600 [Pseudomonadota bacterium]